MPLTAHSFNITFNAALAGLLWLAGIGLTCGAWVGWVSEGGGLVGVASVAAGHLLCMHGLFERQAQREIEAFQLGRESMVRAVR